MASLNKVLLMGNVTRDPELRYISSGTAVLDLGLAVNRRVKSQDGTWTDEATFLTVTVWGKQAESCAEYLSKGRAVFVEGRLHMDQWDDKKTGEKRSRLQITAENVQFLGGGGGRRRAEPGADAPPPQDQDADLSDDDIPF